MSNRGLSFVSLLAVIGLSIVFGMVIGGRLNTPRAVLASSEPMVQLAPAVTGTSPVTDFADIVEAALPAVVSVTSSLLEPRRAPMSNRRTARKSSGSGSSVPAGPILMVSSGVTRRSGKAPASSFPPTDT